MEPTLFSAILLIFLPIIADAVIVNLPNGSIRGRQLYSYKGLPFYAFQEIPYATPPVGDLRFREAIPPKKWKGILDTTANRKICFQNTEGTGPRETEDCLYLNVYTPVNPSCKVKEGLPVLVYIYGGAFQLGDGTYETWGPNFFMDMGIILVTLNYRLGPFGFLTTEDGVIPANLGLKDQVQALKWINKNIGFFGGDKDKVTISGESSGGAAVGYLILSPLAKGLFRGGILQSGTPLCTWSYNRRARKAAYDFANIIDKRITANTSSEDLLIFLRSLPAQTIKNTRLDYGGIRMGLPFPFDAITESPDVENPLITEKMHEALELGNFNSVAIMIGSTSEETIYLADDLVSFGYQASQFDADLSLAVSEDFNVDPANLKAAGAAIRSIYVKGLFQDDLGNTIRYYTDARYTTPLIRHAILHSKVNDAYYYQFSYAGQLGGAKIYDLPGISGNVPHTGELLYFWSFPGEDLRFFPQSDVLTHDRVMVLWSNFVKTLNPTPGPDPLLGNVTWPKATEDQFYYLDIDSELQVKVDPKEYKRWKEIIDTYGNPPYDTY